MELLRDGRPHSAMEIHSRLWDDLSSYDAVALAICRLRKKLPPGEFVSCTMINRESFYQHGRRLVSEPG
jgi:DNA-binding response OmpR family regulator